MAVAIRLWAADRARLSLLVAGCMVALPAVAGEWRRTVSVPIAVEADSNPALAPQGGTALRRTKITPDFTLAGIMGAHEYSVNVALMIERSSDKINSLPRQDPSMKLGWRKATPTGEYGISAKYLEASTRVSELEETGLIAKDGTRKTQSIGGHWRTAISARSSLDGNVDFSNITYDSGPGSSSSGIGLNYEHVWSEYFKSALRLKTTLSRPNAAKASRNTTLTGSAQLDMSDHLNWTFEGGPSGISGTAKTGRWQGNIQLRYTGLRHAASIEVARGVAATGGGGFVESDRRKAGWTYYVDAFTQTGLEGSSVHTKSLLPNTINQVVVWASQVLSPDWSMRLSYQFKQRQEAGLQTASSSLLGINLIYSRPDF